MLTELNFANWSIHLSLCFLQRSHWNAHGASYGYRVLKLKLHSLLTKYQTELEPKPLDAFQIQKVRTPNGYLAKIVGLPEVWMSMDERGLCVPAYETPSECCTY